MLPIKMMDSRDGDVIIRGDILQIFRLRNTPDKEDILGVKLTVLIKDLSEEMVKWAVSPVCKTNPSAGGGCLSLCAKQN